MVAPNLTVIAGRAAHELADQAQRGPTDPYLWGSLSDLDFEAMEKRRHPGAVAGLPALIVTGIVVGAAFLAIVSAIVRLAQKG